MAAVTAEDRWWWTTPAVVLVMWAITGATGVDLSLAGMPAAVVWSVVALLTLVSILLTAAAARRPRRLTMSTEPISAPGRHRRGAQMYATPLLAILGWVFVAMDAYWLLRLSIGIWTLLVLLLLGGAALDVTIATARNERQAPRA